MNEIEKPNISIVPPLKSYFDFIRENKKNSILLGTGVLLVLIYVFFWSAPRNFPVGSIYDLKSGQNVCSVSDNFTRSDTIRSDFWFKAFTYLFTLGKATVIEGDYALYKKENVISLAWRVTHGKLDIVPIKVTIPEGLNSQEIAEIFSKNFPSFDKEIFLRLVQNKKLEGYLFPDTYFILPNMTETEIIKLMNDNYNEKIVTIRKELQNFGKSESDVVKMASILEEEARTTESREIIAGILWKRISIGMALQVDSSFKYICGKTSEALTVADLENDSPYNSYTNTGLPPTPISNPGLAAILAAIRPQKTPYLYFLTDKNGDMHYAVSFEEHVANKQKYLN